MHKENKKLKGRKEKKRRERKRKAHIFIGSPVEDIGR
jgi:hypothetical protein